MEENNKESTRQARNQPAKTLDDLGENGASLTSLVNGGSGLSKKDHDSPVSSQSTMRVGHHASIESESSAPSGPEEGRFLSDNHSLNSERNDDRSSHGRKQRGSDTTGESTSGAVAGDWASQATSAATGRMPLSPSTQGTSIVSKESGDQPRPSSAPGYRPAQNASSISCRDSEFSKYDSSVHNGSLGKADGKMLKKKPSWFRMKRDFPFFSRNKGETGT